MIEIDGTVELMTDPNRRALLATRPIRTGPPHIRGLDSPGRRLDTHRMPEPDSVDRYSRRGGYTWLSPTFTYPHAWTVWLPGRPGRQVGSLAEALRVAAQHDLRLDIDDWTYARMVEDGVAPPRRPAEAHLPSGPDPGTHGPMGDVRPMLWAVLEQAADFIGLTAAESKELAKQRQITLRLTDERTLAVTADYSPQRLNLHLMNGRVASASAG